MTLTGSQFDQAETFQTETVPPEASMVMSALEAGEHHEQERRHIQRIPFRIITQVRLFRDLPDAPGWEVYTRNVNRRGLGFVTRHRLPLGYGGVVFLPGEDGGRTAVHCTLSRCREAAPGWFEGCICFNREQPQLEK
jgi:hypothetical protein